MQGRYLRHPFPCLSIYPVVEVSPQGYWKYPSLVAVVVGEWNQNGSHKAVVFKTFSRNWGYGGANPSTRSGSKNKKATYNCPVVVPLNGARHV
jgi:hypothetical protein